MAISMMIGNMVRVSITALQLGVTPTDVTSITILIKRPDGGTPDGPFTMIHDGAGTYYYDYKPPLVGGYSYEATSVNGDGVYTSTITVYANPF
jgi:hypothetical protein